MQLWSKIWCMVCKGQGAINCKCILHYIICCTNTSWCVQCGQGRECNVCQSAYVCMYTWYQHGFKEHMHKAAIWCTSPNHVKIRLFFTAKCGRQRFWCWTHASYMICIYTNALTTRSEEIKLSITKTLANYLSWPEYNITQRALYYE